MTPKIYTIRQRRSAGLSTSIKKTLRCRRGGGAGVLLLGITILLLILLVFVNAADYALYSHKRNIISKGINYSVCAAVQEIDETRSWAGLSKGFDEGTGKLSTDNIFIDEADADNAFYSTFQSNTGMSRDLVKENLMVVIINPTDSALNYIIKKDTLRSEGSVNDPSDMESVINAKINEYWNSTDIDSDSHVIYVNGNPQTNEFKKRPYYMVFVKDFEIDGLFKKRTATFVGFAGAKIERKY